MPKWKSLMIGAATFFATHAVIVAKWHVWFGGAHEPWFLNAGNGPLALTAGCLCVASIIAAALQARTPHDSVIHGANVAVGATIAAAVVLFAIGAGPLFPIVTAFSGGIAILSTTVGASVVAAFQRN